MFLRRCSSRDSSTNLQGVGTRCSLEFQGSISWRKVGRNRDETRLPRGLEVKWHKRSHFGTRGFGVRSNGVGSDGLREKVDQMVTECLRGVPCDLFLMAQPAPPETLENHVCLMSLDSLKKMVRGKGLHRGVTKKGWKGICKSRECLA